MRVSKLIPIDKFIDKALYDNKKGYYFTKNPFGKNGDFVTSPGISPLFSEMIAIWIVSFWNDLGCPKKFNIIELGPGNGEQCKIMIKTFKKFPNFYKYLNIFLYEKSSALEKVQRNKIKERNITWIKNFNKINAGPALFFGNEFFDAIPIKQFKKIKKNVYEKYLNFDNRSSPKEIFRKVSQKTISKLKKLKLLKKSGIIEYPAQGLRELEVITRKIKILNGGLLLIDYGYLKQLNISTLQSVKLHKKNKIFNNIGKADITSLVNFNLLKDYFKKRNLTVNKIVSQSFFLKKMGILERAEILSKKMSFKEKSDLYFRLERLLSHNYMGNLFKVIFTYKKKKKFLLGFI